MPKEDETNKKRTTSSSTGRGKGTKKGKDGWKCTICTNKFTKDDDKVVQCEYCKLLLHRMPENKRRRIPRIQ